jgi:hypothetical protein
MPRSFYTGASKRASTVHYTSHQAGSHQQHPTSDEINQSKGDSGSCGGTIIVQSSATAARSLEEISLFVF